MKNVLITTSSFGKEDPAPLSVLENTGLDAILNPYERKLSEAEALSLLGEYQPVGLVAGVEPLTEKVLRNTPSLQVISRCGIGMDAVDLNAAKELNVTVTNTPDAPTIPVAELTLGMILGLLRRIHLSDYSIRHENWERPMGSLLYGKTVGIIGCGRIGSRLARMLSAFEITILGADPIYTSHDHLKFVELEQLLESSDIISLHLPYSEQTHHFIDNSRMIMMKKGAFLINASRGGLIDEAALFESLHDGHLGGAALDCFEQEPYKGSLKNLSNVLLTAHIGSYAKEGRIMMEAQAVENLIMELRKRKVIQ